MYMDNQLMAICAAENGYVVAINGREKDDPEPKKDKNGCLRQYPNEQAYIFPDLKALTEFLTEKLPTLIPYNADEEFKTSFLEATQNART